MAVLFKILILLASFTISTSRNNNKDFRYISYEDLILTSVKFSDEGVTSYSQLLFDVSRNQLIVGARDALYCLNIENLALQQKASWKASENKVSLCLDKGQSEVNCHNFIKILLTDGRRLLTCGTGAFSPQCTWRPIENITTSIEYMSGVANCPYNPHANVTALLTDTGQYYVGTPTDFSGLDSAIYRSLISSNQSHPLRTNQYDSVWLSDPQFVGSFETRSFVYFLFRESAVEYINCGKMIYSRIARVCKNDPGGQHMLKENWTTFIKARLNCSIPGEYPFYFNEIQGMSYVSSDGVVYATFTTPQNGIRGSAICAFNMSAIEAAFRGPFKYQENSGSAWEPHYSLHRKQFECDSDYLSRSYLLMNSSKYQLMDNAVQSTTKHPLHISELETLTHIAVDVLSIKKNSSVHVIYVATLAGLIKKISVLSNRQHSCVIEIWRPFPTNRVSPINALHYLKETNSVYVGTKENVIKILSDHCNRHITREMCLHAMDPYCGWNKLQEKCTASVTGDSSGVFWERSIAACPNTNVTVSGGWSAWSEWFQCQFVQSGSESNSNDQCLCQTRKCDNPSPQNGGADCKGMQTRVTNCTVHGDWTPWSAWSACSATCGIALKTRRRTCSNPAPAHGGRVCVGQDRDEIYCSENPPCPSRSEVTQDGQWSVWEPWSSCSVSCGKGFRSRRRKCDEPPPSNGGRSCLGCKYEFEICNLRSCPEKQRVTQWTPWQMVRDSKNSDGNYIERRYRFNCRAPTDEISVSIAKHEDRLCRNDGKCDREITSREVITGWSEWTEWSECSAKCGKGQQHRTRICLGGICDGPSKTSRTCNSPCWCRGTRWSEWSQCSVSCGRGQKSRSKYCVAAGTSDECKILLDYEDCEMPACDLLMPVDSQIVLKSSSISLSVVVGCCLAAFIVGLALACFLTFFYLRFRKTRIPGSPHFITLHQNAYVSVPLREIPSKSMSNDSGDVFSSSKLNHASPSGIPKLYPKSMVDCDTATIKRNSHNVNNGHGLNNHLDKFY